MKNPLEYHKIWGVTLIRKMPFKFNCFRETLKSLRDGGDAFQGARAATALEGLALVLAPSFPVHRRRARFSSTHPPSLGGGSG